ncbi:hypothetical protein Cob_v000546 [Colletotrichum orbiculare MAFF 240422]|uniref:Uncharacterized protein n=1 Tax=Colletotrichum orbiculare (strain 104-T / ATCC 96160 / CBS 514.97 / LARS 414 / MAFF 240422) TaxID=1213857 RepID=A0A484G9P2_COLOR|nr:hypothetical protein Cob_v000546 [Colletotrichum orbiculare MAFF 240422]
MQYAQRTVKTHTAPQVSLDLHLRFVGWSPRTLPTIDVDSASRVHLWPILGKVSKKAGQEVEATYRPSTPRWPHRPCSSSLPYPLQLQRPTLTLASGLNLVLVDL